MHDLPRTRRFFAALGFASALAGCTSGLSRPITSVDAVTNGQGVQHVDVDLHSYYFDPNRIVVRADRPVELVLHNRAVVVPHNFTIADDSLRVSADKWGFGSRTVRFTPTRPGEYRFYCDEGSHSKKGMTGTLVVRP